MRKYSVPNVCVCATEHTLIACRPSRQVLQTSPGGVAMSPLGPPPGAAAAAVNLRIRHGAATAVSAAATSAAASAFASPAFAGAFCPANAAAAAAGAAAAAVLLVISHPRMTVRRLPSRMVAAGATSCSCCCFLLPMVPACRCVSCMLSKLRMLAMCGVLPLPLLEAAGCKLDMLSRRNSAAAAVAGAILRFSDGGRRCCVARIAIVQPVRSVRRQQAAVAERRSWRRRAVKSAAI